MKEKEEFRPERFYDYSDSYERGDYVTGIISHYNLEKKLLYVKFPNTTNDISGFIHLENFIFPSLIDNPSYIMPNYAFNNNVFPNHIPNEIFHIIGHQIYGIVVKKCGNLVEISRKDTMKVAFDFFSTNIGCTIIGCIENVISNAIFVDIGNGLLTHIHISELSSCKYFDARKYFSIGDKVKVKIIGYDSEKQRFLASRKQAYTPDRTIVPGCMVIGTVCEIDGNDTSGYHVECGNPATCGIMDVYPHEVTSGQKVCLIITKKTDKGLRGTFLRHDF